MIKPTIDASYSTMSIQPEPSASTNSVVRHAADDCLLVLGETEEGMTLLPESFKPSKFSVLCNRSQDAKNHHGNKRFQHIVEKSVTKYTLAKSKIDKSLVISDIVHSVRRNCVTAKEPPCGAVRGGLACNGAFVREVNGRWYDIGDDLARKKVSRCLRDACNHLEVKYRSSSHNKKRRRTHLATRMNDELDAFVQSNEHVSKRMRGLSDLLNSKSSQQLSEMCLMLKMTEANREILEGIKHDKSIHLRLNEITKKESAVAACESTVAPTAVAAI